MSGLYVELIHMSELFITREFLGLRMRNFQGIVYKHSETIEYVKN